MNLLSTQGATPSYNSLRSFEASTVMDFPQMKIASDEVFVQHVFDNTDYNVYTIDGKKTFHCLGGIASYTPHYEIEYEGCSKKLKKMPKASELALQQQIKIVTLECIGSDASKNIEFENVD